MANAPLIYGPDGVLRSSVVFTTTSETRFFTGTAPEDTVEMEISINGGASTSDSDLLVFEGTSWTVPNSEVFTEGLDLYSGENTIEVRAILSSGATSAVASATVTLVQESSIGVVAVSPTNITVEQQDAVVQISVEEVSEEGFQGFNLYASKYEGGGDSGYQRVNLELITEFEITTERETVSTLEVEADVLVDANDDPVSDPMYYRFTGQQEDGDEAILQSDFDERVELPETARTLKTTITLESSRDVSSFYFAHNRLNGPTSDPKTISIGEFAATPSDTLLYYVVTAVYFDESRNLEFESAYSQEVAGHPLRVTATIGSLPIVSRQRIVKKFVSSVFRSNPQIKVEPGSTLRDSVIDPFSSEAERMRFIIDFFQRASAPATLLAVDDPSGTSTSISVASSAYKLALKSAFFLSSNSDVQSLIDSCCDSLASKYGKYRRSGKYARGEVTFYTSSRPSRTLQIPLGTLVSGGSQSFRTTRSASIALSELASRYNPITGRYQITVPVQASTAGSTGNVGKGQIRTVGISGLSVINAARMFGGDDEESNQTLMERTQRALASVDSGTKQGYINTAADVPGVLQAKVVGAGDALMQRDMDGSGAHRGGKVDVWVQGENLAAVTDTFAFSFEIAQDVQFEVLGSPSNYYFRANDNNLSSDNPIIEMLDYPDAGYELRNATTGETFDLTDVAVTGYNTIALSTTVAQPTVSLTDVVLGSYRRRRSTTFVLPRQPVSEISSVVGVVSGEIPSAYVNLYREHPPLTLGRSYLAADYLAITAYTDSDGNTVPSGDLVAVSNEAHVLVGAYPEYLDSLGTNFLTIRVYNEARTILYRGPNDTSGVSDYTIILGDDTTPAAIKRVTAGNIASGATVSVDYSHDENFTVTYTTNLVVSVTQEAVEANRHATADVLVKEAVPVPLDLEATVILNVGPDSGDVDTELRTNLENYLTNFRLGEPVRQSDIVSVIENTAGVSYVVLPLTKMIRQAGSQVVREVLATDLSSEITLIEDTSTDSVLVWFVEDQLSSATTDGGGADTEFRGVFEDDVELDLLSDTTQLSALGLAAGRAYIIGSSGALILGLTDDATLIAAGYLTSTTRAAARKEITANRILVSTATGDTPTSHQYSVTYVAADETTAKNIDPGDAEYITTGDFLFTYDEDAT